MTEIAPKQKTQWKNIQYFNRLSDMLRGQLGSNSVADIVTGMSNPIPTETPAAYEEARKVSNVVEGTAAKAEYLDGIGFLNGKENPMTEFTKATEKRPEDIMYLKVLCNLDGPDFYEDPPRDFRIPVLPQAPKIYAFSKRRHYTSCWKPRERGTRRLQDNR